MGVFDDLIPDAQPAAEAPAGGGAFDDLIPQADVKPSGNMGDLFARPSLGERFEMNRRDAVGQSIIGGISGLAEKYLEPERNAQRIAEAKAYEATPDFYTAPTFIDKVLEGGTALAGQVAGSVAAPENLFSLPGKAAALIGRAVDRVAPPVVSKVITQGVSTGAANMAIDPAVQGLNIAADIQNEYEPWRTALSGAIGFGFGATPEAISGVRTWLAGRRGVAEAQVTPDNVTPQEWVEALKAAGATDEQIAAMSPEFGQAAADRLGARREAEAARPAPESQPNAPGATTRDFQANQERLRAEQEAVAAGEMDPAAASTAGMPPRETPETITVDAQGQARTGAPAETVMDRVANLNRNMPAVVERQPTRMTPDEIARSRAKINGGQPDGAAVGDARPVADGAFVAPDGRAPQTRDDVQGQRDAGGAFDLAARQRDRANQDIRDTQPAARPEGINAQEVFLDDGFPVQVVERRMMPDANGRMVEVAKVQRYDPRTGQPEPDAPAYDVPVRQLKRSSYAQEPRMAQDFNDRAQSPRNPEQPRMATEGVRQEPDQTYRATAADPNEQFPGATGGRGPDGPTGRSPFPEQPDGPSPWRERSRTEEEVLRRYEEARAREEARRAAGDAQREGPRDTDAKASNTPKGQDKDGRFAVDDRGFVVSSKGGPIRFADQKQAARWILKEGQKKSPDQVFEIANHPGGKGFTVLERGRTDPPPGGGKPADENVRQATPNADAATRGPLRIGMEPGADQPVINRAIDDIASGKVKPTKADVARAYTMSEKDASDLLGKIYRRPDSPIEAAKGKYADDENVSYRRKSADKRVEEMRQTANWARKELGINRSEYPNEKDFMDAVEERMAIREADDPFVQADRAREGAASEDIPFDGEPQRPSGAKLYSGLPLDAMVDEAKRLFGWTAKGAAEWKKSMQEFAAEHSEWLKNRKLTQVPGRSLFNAVLGDATAEVRGVANKLESEKAKKLANDIIDEWFVESGTTGGKGRTYDEAVSAREVSRLNDLGDALGKFMDDDKSLEQIVNMVRNPGTIRKGTPLGDAASNLQKLLRDELEYLRAAGVEVGEVKNGYFPRSVDEMKVRANPDGFVAKATEAYRKAGLSSQDARAAAESWRDNIMFGDNGSVMVPPGGTIDANFVRGRALPKEADKILLDFLINDPKFALVHYLTRAARRAEFTRRIGPENSRWQAQVAELEKDGAGHVVPYLREFIATMAGVKPSGMGKGVNTLSWARTWGTLGLLEKATLTSIPEMMMPGIRSGSPADLARSVGYTLIQMFKKDAKSVQRQREIAEDIGMVVAHGNHMLSAARFAGGDVSSKVQQKVLQTYFRNTGLERWTNATRVAAVGVGQTFLRRLSREFDGSPNTTKALLAELGVPKEKAADFSKWVLAQEGGLPNAAALAGAKNKAIADMYRTALIRFADQTIMRPSAATRPRWASHPFGATVFHLMNYTWAFQKNVINRPFRLMMDKELTVMERARIAAPMIGMMPVLWAMQGLVSEGREALFGDPTRTEPRSSQEKALLWLSRAGLTGKLDPFVNIATGVRYGRDVATSALGPVFGRLATGAQTAVEYATRNSARTNAAERKMAKTAYDLGVEPAINYLLSALPGGSVAAALARQGAGSGAAREAFTENLAGPPEKTSGKPGATRGLSSSGGLRGGSGLQSK